MNNTVPSVPSELARRLAAAYENADPASGPEILIDAELQEVREVLAEVIREHDDPMSDYGCTTHTTERARTLLYKLRIEPSGNE